jgi:hypothetical protein
VSAPEIEREKSVLVLHGVTYPLVDVEAHSTG